ncbi:hypothetical protein CWI37_1069p0020 [Hamiltosporidium tvaerminnensis]|uniref:Uncharacterized protein n=1 Tax=Hamiltosporidium tvaerminnensis TaxID=1176355 RepID=A0A4Q9KZ00_9MICR|nr:hypothetical protein CWI37_1069p0020 [Hamiltosporidium tvaerminnensis]
MHDEDNYEEESNETEKININNKYFICNKKPFIFSIDDLTPCYNIENCKEECLEFYKNNILSYKASIFIERLGYLLKEDIIEINQKFNKNICKNFKIHEKAGRHFYTINSEKNKNYFFNEHKTENNNFKITNSTFDTYIPPLKSPGLPYKIKNMNLFENLFKKILYQNDLQCEWNECIKILKNNNIFNSIDCNIQKKRIYDLYLEERTKYFEKFNLEKNTNLSKNNIISPFDPDDLKEICEIIKSKYEINPELSYNDIKNDFDLQKYEKFKILESFKLIYKNMYIDIKNNCKNNKESINSSDANLLSYDNNLTQSLYHEYKEMLNDMYKSGMIFYKMKFKEFIVLIKEKSIFIRMLKYSGFPVKVLFFEFIQTINNRLKEYENKLGCNEPVNLNSIDLKAIQTYFIRRNNELEKEEGEL